MTRIDPDVRHLTDFDGDCWRATTVDERTSTVVPEHPAGLTMVLPGSVRGSPMVPFVPRQDKTISAEPSKHR